MIPKLLTLREKDIFSDGIDDVGVEYIDRQAVKMVIVDNEGQIALVGRLGRLLPGGGVEKGETLVEAVKRECLEEVGCEIVELKEMATTEEYRSKIKIKQTTHFFTAKLEGEKNRPQTTQEDEQEMEVEWMTLDQAMEKLKEQIQTIPKEAYHSNFNVRTHLAFLEYLVLTRLL